MKTTKSLIMVVATVLFLSACKKDRNDNHEMDNQMFVTQASSSNNFEVQAGAMAMTKAQSGDVKHYGEHMVSDHTAVGNEMKQLSAGKGWTVPTTLQPKEQANLNLLAATDQANFDKEFMRIMVASHQDAVSLFSMASGATGVYDADLRTFAASKLPSLNTHLEEAVNLQAKIK
ncbi:DUF4142 domain-containing protein [Pedobacter endophyticus]|uniref:DUF4142 domain-containing protein n=1 Tax=Pedobacter endophyticus TaxID=2789740 RepID=A0A7S9L0Y5_9SPHI|nr:DUF4142 domain-containing protein [Pedobacter endophyticus]QPH40480.1 DUF4142 domain-containing protein [Pedobacter endophyticus]